MSTNEEMREEGEQRERDIASGWSPALSVDDDMDDGEGRMRPIFQGIRPFVRSKELFFDEQMKHAEAERDLSVSERFAY